MILFMQILLQTSQVSYPQNGTHVLGLRSRWAFTGIRGIRGVLALIDHWLAQPRTAQRVVVLLSLYLVAFTNMALWADIAQVGGAPSLYLRSSGAMALLVLAGTTALLSFTAWSRGMRPVWFLLVVVAAFAQYFMLTYQTVMDPGMTANMLQTDPHEVSNLLTLRMLPMVLSVLVLPAWALVRIRLLPMQPLAQIGRNLVLLALALATVAATVMVFSRDLAPLMRNNPLMRYRINPLATLYSTTLSVVRPLLQHNRKLLPMTAGAALGATHAAQSKPLLFVLVVGETARADHFGLNGYDRDTTPALAARKVFNWTNVRSCGTSTLASVPCMFSPLGKSDFEARDDDYENLLDVVQAAGMNVLWLDNQSGCKGVCDRVPHAEPSESLTPAQRSVLCPGGECLDDTLLVNLNQRLEAMPVDKRARGTLLVMHQMGSHGPSYWKRSSAASKRFLPECKTQVLAECSHAELTNAFDNSIAETDAFLGHTIDWLKTQAPSYDTGMLYVSDHGESLGEFGLFLHGAPYRVAPDVQKHVPMVAWFAPGLMAREQISDRCLRASADAPITHDNLYHSVLGLLDVASPSYHLEADAFAACRQSVRRHLSLTLV